MSKQKSFILPDPEKYYRLSKPFPDADKANEALLEFYRGIGELREKLGIADVHVTVRVDVAYEDGVGPVMAEIHFGDSEKAESMTAWAYGRNSAMRQERIAKLIAEAPSIKVPVNK